MPWLLLKNTFIIFGLYQCSYNACKKDMPFTDKKNGAFTNDLNVDEIKKMCK